MKHIVLLLITTTFLFASNEMRILFSGISSKDMPEQHDSFEKQLKSIWGSDTGITFIKKDLVERIKYRTDSEIVTPDSSLRLFLQRYDLDSVTLLVPEVVTMDVSQRRRFGVRGVLSSEIAGVLKIRYRFISLESGKEVSTVVINSDTTIPSNVTLLRPTRKTNTVSASERQEISNLLIEQNIRSAYLHVYSLLYPHEDTSLDTANSAVSDSTSP